MTVPLKILSLGAGVQSSTVLLMSCRGVLPKLDAAIFADTRWEPKAVYEWLTVLQREAQAAGIPIYRVSAGNLRDDALRSRIRKDEYDALPDGRWASMPLYTNGGGGQIKRQCTSEYKIEPIRKQIAHLVREAGLTKTPGVVEQWFGISGDEQRRMRLSRVRYITHYYPLVFGFDRPMQRHHCVTWLTEQGFPSVPRSACLGCPYHSDEEWARIKTDPVAWADVVQADEAIRKIGGQRDETFLHRSCKPLAQIDFRSMEELGQQNWLNECTGMCGV